MKKYTLLFINILGVLLFSANLQSSTQDRVIVTITNHVKRQLKCSFYTDEHVMIIEKVIDPFQTKKIKLSEVTEEETEQETDWNTVDYVVIEENNDKKRFFPQTRSFSSENTSIFIEENKTTIE